MIKTRLLNFLFPGAEFVDDFVEKGFLHRKSPDAEKADGRYVFLHELVKQTDNKVQIRSELLNILLAGRDTTASLLSNVWWEISKRPDVWAKLRAEVDALGGAKPTFEQIKDMKYLRWVLNESLRYLSQPLFSSPLSAFPSSSTFPLFHPLPLLNFLPSSSPPHFPFLFPPPSPLPLPSTH